MDPTDEIELEFPRFVRFYKSGRIERLSGTDVVPPSFDPKTSVTSRDAQMDPQTGVWARLYLPTSPIKKLPILLYAHGGGFIIESAASPTYHNYLNALSSKADILVVSVDYRRAPEHRLPAAYDDTMAALEWMMAHADGGSEAWLAERADFSRVFLAGDSAGANIAHYVALRAPGIGIKIKGVALIHPYFWGLEPVGQEIVDERMRAKMEKIWRFVCTETVGLDDPRVNPAAAVAEGEGLLGCERVLVTVAEKDILRERGRAYYERLKGQVGWGGEVEFLESDGEEHVFHVRELECEKALELMDRLVSFFNRD